MVEYVIFFKVKEHNILLAVALLMTSVWKKKKVKSNSIDKLTD